MSTNYDLVLKNGERFVCHIGKLSGSSFTFSGTNFKTVSDWKTVLSSNVFEVNDAYGNVMSGIDFIENVIENARNNNPYYDQDLKRNRRYIDDGFMFNNYDFS